MKVLLNDILNDTTRNFCSVSFTTQDFVHKLKLYFYRTFLSFNFGSKHEGYKKEGSDPSRIKNLISYIKVEISNKRSKADFTVGNIFFDTIFRKAFDSNPEQKKLQQYSCVLFAGCGSNHPSSSSEQLTQSIHGQTRPRRPRRPWTRAVFSNLQRKGLEKRFQVQKYLTKADRHQLASMLGLSDNQVKVWFQNRRMKWRQEARESVTSTNTEAEDEKS